MKSRNSLKAVVAGNYLVVMSVITTRIGRRNAEIAIFIFFVLLTLGIYPLTHGSALAASAIAKVMCDIMSMILLDIGRAVATVSVVGLGISATLGKATLTHLWVILAGIGVVFGAPIIMMTILSSDSLNSVNNATEFLARATALGVGCGITLR